MLGFADREQNEAGDRAEGEKKKGDIQIFVSKNLNVPFFPRLT